MGVQHHPAMPSIGELANDAARALYELRIPVLIGSILAAVAIAAVAWRRGWIAAAGRHPMRTAVLVVAALVVAVPVGWYLGSPLIIRTSLVEAGPTTPLPAPTADVPDPSGEGGSLDAPTDSPPATIASEAAPTPTPTPFVPSTITAGEFEGTDDFHFGRGTASIIEVAPGRYHLRLEDFSVRNGPDLYVYLSPSPDGYADDALELGTLKATDGSFGYDLPEGTDPSRFRSAIIWCKQFSHLFATAPFGRA
jgi:hypothetical protein